MPSMLERNEFFSNPIIGRIFRVFASYQSKISTLIAVVFICLSAWSAAGLVWSFLGEETQIPQWSANPISKNKTTDSKKYDISTLIDSNLFGQYTSKAAEVVSLPVIPDAPETSLNLMLVGVVSSSHNSKRSLAVVSNGGSQATYSVGEKITGTKVELVSIFADRVIVNNSGRNETLMLNGINYDNVKRSTYSPNQTNSRTSQANNRTSSKTFEKTEGIELIRAEVLEEPEKILQYIRLSQVKKDGKLIGYRVKPGAQRILFDAVGLENGDIAISLNGEDLTDPASMAKIWQSISELTEFSLTVDRNGQTHEIYVAF